MVINGLWIGDNLSSLENLSIQSYLFQGYTFNLWTYEPLSIKKQRGLNILDANEIITKKEVFKYRHKSQFGHGKGSYAGFSDLFRFKLLHLHGGWWTDMDVTCLKALPEVDDYFFRKMKGRKKSAVGNLMYCKRNSPLMEWCYRKASNLLHAENRNWMLPITILNDGIEEFKLEDNIHDISNPDSWLYVSKHLKKNSSIEHHHVFHWMNEEFRRLNIPKDRFIEHSTIQKLMVRYGIQHNLIDNPEEIRDYHSKISTKTYLIRYLLRN